jgi:hypothetical protein
MGTTPEVRRYGSEPLSGAPAANLGFSELPDGRGGTNIESIAYTEEMGFDKERSLAAFQDTLYPLLRARSGLVISMDILSRDRTDLTR